jgi:hypothetical protein
VRNRIHRQLNGAWLPLTGEIIAPPLSRSRNGCAMNRAASSRPIPQRIEAFRLVAVDQNVG